MLLTPSNVDEKLSAILEEFAEKNNLWLGYIKIEDADIPRTATRNYDGFIIPLYIGADVDESINFSQYLAIRHQILLGYNIPAKDRTNKKTRTKLWNSARELENKLTQNDFMCTFGSEDIPATDIRMLLFITFNKGSPGF